MTHFEVTNGNVIKRQNAASDTESRIVDPDDNPVAARVLDLCAHYGITAVTCDPGAGRGSLTRGSLSIAWDGYDLDTHLPDVGFRDDAAREGAAESLTTWLEVAEELERLFKRFDDPSVLGSPALSVTFDGPKVKVLVYRGPVVLAEYVSEKTGWFKASEYPLSDRLTDWAETLIAGIRGEALESLSQISLRAGYEALYLTGWYQPVKDSDLPAEFPGRPAIQVVRQGLADLVLTLDNATDTQPKESA